MIDEIRRVFLLPENDMRSYSPLVLAYIGDGVFDAVVRTMVVSYGNAPTNILHSHTSHVVRAGSQARMILAIEDELSGEEEAVYKRGRNAKSHTMAKNASMREYRLATGFEALIGYLYLAGRSDRMYELIRLAMSRVFGNDLREFLGS